MTRSCFGDLGGVKSCWGYNLKLVNSKDAVEFHNYTSNQNVTFFSMKELQKATNNFSTKIGWGGFASYYKGTLKNGTSVMIRMVSHSDAVYRKQDPEFISNIVSLSRIRHRNVVEILGCCVENDEMFMVYKFVGDYNLDQLLFVSNSKAKQTELSWSMRASICIGIARGLEYLHEGSKRRVVHRDIKPSNIVLDSNLNPKIIDFGLALLFDDDVSYHSAIVAGTWGYIAPEIHEGRYTVKADVYSFGILLLEVISGRKVYDFKGNDNGFTLVSWVWELRETSRILEVVDPTLSDFPEDEVKAFIDVALMCVQSSAILRPRISEALLMLLRLCDISEKKLKNPEQSVLSNYPNRGIVALPSSGHLDSNDPASDWNQKILASNSTFINAPSHPSIIGSASKVARAVETEIESGLDSISITSDLMEKSHYLETELYTSVEEHCSTAAPVIGPSDKTAVKVEIVEPSSLSTSIHNPSFLSTDIHVHQEAVEAAEQTQVSHEFENEIQVCESPPSEFLIGPTVVDDNVKFTSSAEMDRFNHIEAVNRISSQVLSNADAWGVFYCQVRDVIINSPEIEPYARAICKECYGSPVIISAVGGALKAESSVVEWKFALKCLQSGSTSSINDQCFFGRHIRYCYDRLKDRDLKTCFLYTALFQEDREIDISTLVEFFINEGLVSGTTISSYNKGHDIVGHLTNASLLEANDDSHTVKMHNIVKNSAIDILSLDIEAYQAFVRLPNSEKDDNQSFQECRSTFNSQLPVIHKYSLTRAGAHMKESPTIQEWEQSTMIFLMDNELSRLPNKPKCSTLVALFLQRNSCLRVIPESFFDSMSTLKILNLSSTRIKTLPDSFCGLSSLQILLLRDCKRLLVLPTSIGLLKSLKVLDLQGTEVILLPDCVGNLTSLEHLSVSFYGSMNHSEYKRLPSKLVSDGIILSLKIRELRLFVYPGDRRWILNASSITKEISYLKLSVLNFHFPKVEDLECFVHESHYWKSKSLTTFSIVVGHDFKRIVSLVSNDVEVWFNEGQRRLRFVNGENVPDSVVEVLKEATSFYLDHHLTISYLSQFGIHSFAGLKICILRDCPELIEIVDMEEETNRNLFPVLEILSINNLWKLERVWVCPIAKGSLSQLRCLSVHACPKLRYVFTCSMLNTLSNLEELVIEDCASLKYIVIGDDDVKEIMCGDVDAVFDKAGLPVLHSLKVLKLHYLPKLRGIWRGEWPLLEYISFYNCPLLRNLHMKVNDDIHVKEIAADKAWWDSLFWKDLELSRRLHNRLTQIHVNDL